MNDPLRTADHDVLAENTAQTVLKHLQELDENRHAIGTRWIWELLQNARDASKPGGNSVTVRLTESELVFSHDGRPFRVKELAHLIRHGSTKVDAEDAVGRYGSGFISTHLLSRRVRVRGQLDTGQFFDFWLDRNATDQDRMTVAMNRSLDECIASYRPSGTGRTEYTYPLTEEAFRLAEAGLQELTAWAPLVLAFADQLTSIDADQVGHRGVFRRGMPTRIGQDVDLFPIEDGRPNSPSRYVAVLDRSDGMKVALPLEGPAPQLRVALRPETPRLFILFPLLTTDRLGLPGVVHCRRFKPRESRDGVTLFSDSEVGRNNQLLLGSSISALGQLLGTVAAQGWAGGEELLSFDVSRLPDWVQADWYRELLRPLLERARAERILTTESGERIAPEAAWIPLASTPDHGHRLRELALGLAEGADRLPHSTEAAAWSRNLSRWADLLETPEQALPGAFSVGSLAVLVSATRALPSLGERLVPGSVVGEWIADFLNLLVDSGQTRLLGDLTLLPNQSDQFCKVQDIARDLGIDEDLKNIADDLGTAVRAGLLHTCLAGSAVEGLLGTKSEGQVLDAVLNEVTKEVRNGRIPTAHVDCLATLFWWIVTRPAHLLRLEGLPVPTADADDSDCAVLTLRRSMDHSLRPLGPIPCWPESSRRFAGLFPKKRILHSLLASDDGREEHWRQLQSQHQVFLSPLFEFSGQLKDAQLVRDLEGDAHAAVQPLSLSDIVALEDRDTGLIDTARKARSKAILLVEFILGWVLDADTTAFELVEAACECGAGHAAYRAGWLRPLRARTWVPRREGETGADKPSAESLARLVLAQTELARDLQTERGQRLLLGLGIRPADFALCVAAPTEDARLSIVQLGSDLSRAAGGHEAAAAVVNEIVQHPETIEVIKAQRERREKVIRNQAIGTLVEQLLREALASAGLNVTRTGRGSDFEVESDFVDGEHEVFLELSNDRQSTLVEVKSARADVVKMTPAQATMASETGEGFALCVVPLSIADPDIESVRHSCRFVFGIGTQLDAALQAYSEICDSTENARSRSGPVSLDITEGQTRFRVAQEVWTAGLSLVDAVTRFQRGPATAAPVAERNLVAPPRPNA